MQIEDNSLQDQHNSSHHDLTKAEFNNIVLLLIQNISKLLTSLPSHRLSSNFGLFLITVSGYKWMLFLADTPQKCI